MSVFYNTCKDEGCRQLIERERETQKYCDYHECRSYYPRQCHERNQTREDSAGACCSASAFYCRSHVADEATRCRAKDCNMFAIRGRCSYCHKHECVMPFCSLKAMADSDYCRKCVPRIEFEVCAKDAPLVKAAMCAGCREHFTEVSEKCDTSSSYEEE